MANPRIAADKSESLPVNVLGVAHTPELAAKVDCR
jgi:hypothetical protein